jgi:rubrerythrin
MDIKVSGDLNGILELLKFMVENELVIGELYKTCGEKWKDDEGFWMNIYEDENKHAQYINRMIGIISNRPERFEKGRPFNIFAIKTVISGVQDKIQKTKKGGIPKNNALFIARDLEQAMIEDKYGEIVKTDDVEFKSLVQEIVNDTNAHKTKINQKIAEVKKDKPV